MRYAPLWLATAVLAIFVGTATAEEFKIIRVSDLAKLIDSKTPNLAILDANSASTREREGIIPGSLLLSSSRSYDVAKELPADHASKLVFYCANSH